MVRLLLLRQGHWKERLRCHCWETLVADTCASPMDGLRHPSFKSRSGAPLALLDGRRRRIRRKRRGLSDLDGAPPGSDVRRGWIDCFPLITCLQCDPFAGSLGTVTCLADDIGEDHESSWSEGIG